MITKLKIRDQVGCRASERKNRKEKEIFAANVYSSAAELICYTGVSQATYNAN
jgi:hypothetical protein